jgi:aspartokinase/homoserine dehydrogenase 1
MKVLKFGGTSVANAQNIKLVLDIVLNKAKQDKLVVVVSAFTKVTDLLVLASQKSSFKRRKFQGSSGRNREKTFGCHQGIDSR